jgi:hypothetical protein
MEFIVMCRVSGGVTGTRESVMKREGEPIVFPTREEAQAYADKANERVMHCNHRAWVEER